MPLGIGLPAFTAATAAGVAYSSRYCLTSGRSTIWYSTPDL